jgi:hypothetical protein
LRRGAPGASYIGVELKDGGAHERALGPVSDDWQTLYLPLDQFSGLDLQRAREFTLLFRPDPGAQAPTEGELFVRDIAFVSGEQPPFSGEQVVSLMRSRGCGFFIDAMRGGTGLVWDRASDPDRFSIAGTGFGLGALCVAEYNGLISRAEAESLAIRCLDSLLAAQASFQADAHGFLYHFLRPGSPPARDGDCEVSSVDTALMAVGALIAGQHFGGAVRVKAKQLYDAIDWTWLYDDAKGLFRMQWKPGEGFAGHWDYYTDEVLLIDILAAGANNPEYALPLEKLLGWRRERDQYDGVWYYKSWFGSLFCHTFGNLWVNLRGMRDKHPTTKVDWWGNTQYAINANRSFCAGNQQFGAYQDGRWGITACLRGSPDQVSFGQWEDYGAGATGATSPYHAGFLAPYASAMCLPWLGASPNAGADCLWSFWDKCRPLWGIYGFGDGCSLGGPLTDQTPWYSQDHVSIAKGPMLLGIENARSQLIWNLSGQAAELVAGRSKLFAPG